MKFLIISLVIIWLIGWIHQWAFNDAMFRKCEDNKIFAENPEVIKFKKHPILNVIVLFFTWPYFYFYWKY